MINIKKCCLCHSKNIVYTKTEIYCANCGLVLATTPPHYIGGKKFVPPFGFLYG